MGQLSSAPKTKRPLEKKCYTNCMALKRHVLLCAIVTCLLCVVAGQSTTHAQSIDSLPNEIANLRYRTMVNEIMRAKNLSVDFSILRLYYTDSDFYDPFGSEPADKLVNLAFEVVNTDNEEKKASALSNYNNVLYKHLANVGVLSQAIALTREHEELGNLDQLIKIRERLLENIRNSGTGLSLDAAFDIITMDEEFFLINSLGLELMHTENVQEGRTFYNMHSVYDPRKDAAFTLFVNINKPMEFLEKQRRLREERRNPAGIERF